MSREEDFRGFEWPGGDAGERPRRFTAAELVACEACLRGNAPTRMKCLYCGAALPFTEQSAALRRPTLKRLEEWEQGFNVVLLHGAAAKREELEEAAALLRLDAGRLEEIVESRRALPLARTGSAEEAGLVLSRLGALGLEAEIYADAELTRTPVRVRALDFEEGALVLRPGPEAAPHALRLGEVALLLTGRIVERRVEVAERKARFGARSEVVESRELASDELVLDIYEAGEGLGFRVMSGGFDYSCLGARKGLLAAENFGTLVETLCGLAGGAAFDEEYTRLRPLLADVWPPAEQTGSLGLRREGTRVNTGDVTTVSNEAQFTRYARLRQRLASRERARKS